MPGGNALDQLQVPRLTLHCTSKYPPFLTMLSPQQVRVGITVTVFISARSWRTDSQMKCGIAKTRKGSPPTGQRIFYEDVDVIVVILPYGCRCQSAASHFTRQNFTKLAPRKFTTLTACLFPVTVLILLWRIDGTDKTTSTRFRNITSFQERTPSFDRHVVVWLFTVLVQIE